MQVLFGFDGASAPKYGRISGGVGWASAPGVNDFGFQRLLGQPVKTSTKKTGWWSIFTYFPEIWGNDDPFFDRIIFFRWVDEKPPN